MTNLVCTHKSIRFVFLLIYVIIYVDSELQSTDNTPLLKHVTVFFRHADRTPSTSEFSFGNFSPSENFSSLGIGQLTPKGLARSYKFGEFLRDRYKNQLALNENAVIGYSRSINRTIESLKKVVEALCLKEYKGVETIWNCKKESIYIVKDSHRILSAITCAQFQKEYQKVLNSIEVENETGTYQLLFQKLSASSGQNITKIQNLFTLYQLFLAEDSMGLPIPDWAQFYMANITRGANYFYEVMSYNTVLKRLNGGAAIRGVLDSLEKIKAGKLKNFLTLYSAQETHIAAISRTLGFNFDKPPYFLDAMIFEIWEIQDNYFVKTLFHNGHESDERVTNLNVKNCAEYCRDKEFISLLPDLIPSDEEYNEC